VSTAGALLFARYAYPPNALGYCGPEGADALLVPGAAADIAARARQFEGAWSYLEFLAEAAGIADPLDEAVVEAYWIGSDLLAAADPRALTDRLLDRFRGQSGGTWREAGDRAIPHHAFQVFEVYPWATLLEAGGHPVALSVLDQCRIRTGTVLSAGGETAQVRSRPLTWDGTVASPGDPRVETARWSAGGRSLLSGLAPGDRVALHWDWICDVITAEQATQIEATEAQVISGRCSPPVR
jgi:hypothetical protein